MEVNRSMETQAPGRHTRIVKMSVQQASTHYLPPRQDPRQHSHALDTRLHGRWVLLVRGVWLALAILTLGGFLAGLPVYLTQLQTPCASTTCEYGVFLTPEQIGVLKGIGLSLGDYAAYNVALALALVVICLVVSTVIVWRRS